ncbi:HIT family hydrolase [Caloranaerobacter sp. TR13]|uniref:histidine triad nucleotide-binding protein n=1 Tax=Caloranaerobacter sp. TR13 TaxID=1302151 RepID=UPI0006D4480E|nr:histidine triad nucleotide-binding protein [Caloranaerobacter sp. TR13]KPU27931.1 HIT family hydrolase [Caloranaerobacter sp. TR13]
MSNCIFCKIVNGEIPSKKVYEDDKVLAFEDINPQAPVHILVVPKEHIPSIKDINEDNIDVISHIHLVIKKLAKEKGIDQDGFRIVNNCGEKGGQTVGHLHYHLLGGRHLMWPPG